MTAQLSHSKKVTLGLLFSLISLSYVKTQANSDVGIDPLLFGVDLFMQANFSGISTSSMAGGAEIMYYGQGLSHAPEDFTVFFQNTQYNLNTPGPALTKDNSFYSQTAYGKLEYTTPSLMTLFGQPYEAFDSIDWITFYSYLIDSNSDTGVVNQLDCQSWQKQNCYVSMSRAYTPQLYFMVPRVMYHGGETTWMVDPRSAQDKRQPGDLPFYEARVDNKTVDFEPFISEDTVLAGYSQNPVRSNLYNLDPNPSSTVSMVWRVGNSYQKDTQMLQCDISNTTCYKAKVVPIINQINATSGYTSGGQILQIDGYGFSSSNLNVQVDGVNCQVLSQSKTSLTCKTGAQPSPSTDTYYVGSNGLKHRYYNITDTSIPLTYARLDTEIPYYSRIDTTTETPTNQLDGWDGNTLKGYFKPPITANYRFYVACDDSCIINLGTANMDPTTKTQIFATKTYASYRNYITPDNSLNTDWISLQADNYYYFEAYHLQFGGNEHLTVSVEIQTTFPGHQNAMSELQRLRINPTNIREQSQITINNPSSDKFTIIIMPPGQTTPWTATDISSSSSASAMQAALSGYWSTYYAAPISVTLTMYNASGNVVTTMSQSVQNVYTITVNKALSSDSITSRPTLANQAATATSSFSFLMPREVQKSSIPLTGSFTITCPLADGTMNTTGPIPTSTPYYNIPNYLNVACYNLKEKYQIWEGPAYSYTSDGRDLMIRFIDMRQDLPQLTIQSYNANPVVGNDVTYASETVIPFGQTLFYEPIPFEWLYTAETQPQVLVTVDGLPAVCNSFECGYNYVVPSALVTSFSLSGLTLTINGNSLPISSNIVNIMYSNVLCVPTSVSTTQITCTLTSIVAGSWTPQITDINGLVPVDPSVTAQTIPIVVASISPNTNVNPNGGGNLIITGSNFPTSLTDGSSMSVVFSDSTVCQVTATSSTSISCLTSTFSAPSQTLTATITINGQTDSSHSIQVSTSPATVTSVTPQNVSPVLKTQITLQVDASSFTGSLQITDLSVKIIDSNRTRANDKPLNVIAVDDTAKTITVKFGGAYSGTYNINVYSETYGTFDTSQVTLIAIGQVSDFTPKTGSVYGGTLVTITGYTFGTDATDNPVMIGNSYCLVQTTSANQITCRTSARDPSSTSTAEELVVFLKTSEEAVCNEANQCQFTWMLDESLPSLTSYTVAFNSAVNDYQVTLTGTGFPTSTSDVIFMIDGVQQTVVSTSATTIVVTINSMLSSSSQNIEFYLPTGTPAGASQLTTTGITLTPVILSTSPATGSPAGSVISAVVKGVGNSSTAVTLTTSSGTVLCASVYIPSYGNVICTTIAANFSSTTVKVKVGSSSYSCSNTANCAFQTSTSMPAVTSATIGSDQLTMTITGTNFFTAGFTGLVNYAGVNASSVTINSNTQLQAVWNMGIPVTQTAVSPTVSFQSTTTTEKHWAQVTATVANVPTVSAITSAVSCSFAGGCTLQVDQPGLASQLAVDGNELQVCGYECTLLSSSTSSSVKCAVPPLSTTYSITNYQITAVDYILGTMFASNSSGMYTLTNGQNQDYYYDTSPTCYFGTYFKSGFIGELSEVSYFMPVFNRNNFINNLKFQGSMDGVTYTDIFTVGQEIHEGWNYYDYRDNNLKYRYYRFQGSQVGACQIGEVSFRGVEAIDSTASSYQCPVTLSLAGQSVINLSGLVTYTSTLTPVVTDISPRFGKVQGGDLITFTGTGFSASMSDITVTIDDINCAVQSASTTQITCLTGSRPGLFPNPYTQVYIAGMGQVALQGKLMRYVNFWSMTDTWGGEFQPVENESVYVPPGLQLLVDVDSTPVLDAVLVEGSLIFPPSSDPTHLRTFDANYIFVYGGYMEVGTEDYPYTSQLIITMHGDRQSPDIPIFGNKVIAVMQGILDMHGAPRMTTWTELLFTAPPGSTNITLLEPVDWQPGENIVIAPTGYDNKEAELVTISSVDQTNPNNPVVYFTQPLVYNHYAGIQTFGTDTFEMRAEVGLITRNVVFRGDPETSSLNEYGAHIMLHSAGDESLIGRIEYCEFRDVGQAYQLGRYPIHFHLIGTVMNSYVQGNSIHSTYNRAVTMHGVHYLRVLNNVAYNTMGHTFFIEDAIETKNQLDHNLAVLTQASYSLLITDQTPASFWITHPDNIFTNNHAAGADRYGYWFDTKPNPTGPSYTPYICPENDKVGEFSNNVAHSNGRYGLRIFHNIISRQNPCQPIFYNASNPTDPYASNPIITNNFTNFRSWKNLEVGAIVEKVGDVRFIDFQVADNLVSGIEFSLTGETMDGTAQIINALCVGHSENAEQITMNSSFFGITTPRTENFQVNGAKFYNYDQPGHACLGSCSHCFHPAATDSGARTVTFTGLYFDTTVVTKIRYQFPYRAIYYDKDGTLTGLGAGSWATAYWPHNVQPECQVNLDIYDGILCDNTVQVRRLAMYNYQPGIFNAMELKITKWDDNLVGSNKTAYLESLDNDTDISIVPFKEKQDPMNGWAIPYVTGHKYKVHWRYGLDFTQMQIDLSSRWNTTDKDVYLVFNFTDVRQEVQFTSGGDIIPNMTLINETNSEWQTADNVVYNDTATREIHTVINGRNLTKNSVLMEGFRCVGPCLSSITDIVVEANFRRWSDPNSWPNQTLPANMSDVEVQSGWNMLYDMAETDPPTIYNMVQVNGRLTFEDGVKDLTLRAKYLFVRAGELVIGNVTNPYQNKATIVLHGEKANEAIVYDNAIEAGNKILANTASISIYGNPRNSITRLLATAYPGDTQITVEKGLDWRVGDELGLTSSTLRYNDTDYVIVVSYDMNTGIATLDRPLTGYHWGSATSTAPSYNGVDMRNEVYMLTRNVKIQGQDIEAWGCQIVTSDFVEADATIRMGRTYMNNVQIYNCSQYDTYKAALRFEGSQLGWSEIAYSSIYNGLGYGVQIENAANVQLTQNVVFGFIKRGINIVSSQNITLDGNHVSFIGDRNLITLDELFEPTGCIIACADVGDSCEDIQILNNVASAAIFTGFAAYAHNCGDYSTVVFMNNVVHSIRDTGAIIFANPNEPSQKTCAEASNLVAYKCGLDGAIGFHNGAWAKLVFSNMTFIDNGFGGTVMVGMEGDNLAAQMNNVKIYGETEARDCFYQNECSNRDNVGCIDRSGLMLAYFSTEGKDPLPSSTSSIPVHHIKKDASYGGKTTYTNLQFINFLSNQTWCGGSQYMIVMNPDAADYIPRAQFQSTIFNNTDFNTFAYLFSPPYEWANLDDCADFPCTAPNNALLQFYDSKFVGNLQPTKTTSNFQIVPNNIATVKGYNYCTSVPSWNAYYCNNDNLGVLLFESMDSDKWSRMVSPIYIVNNATNSVNTLNTFMDHIWDGFYTGQLRMGRWPTIIQTGTTMTYDIDYKGTPPQAQRFSLFADYSGVVLRITYSTAGSYAVTDFNGNVIAANPWDDSLKALSPIQRQRCGENRFLGVVNVLEFYITAGCNLMIEPLDSIRAAVRMQWTLNEFYADGGTTQFVDRLAAVLGIHASTIKIVAVYEGSVIVEFQITPTGVGSDTVANVQSKVQSTLLAGQTFLGAPIIGLTVNDVPLVTDGTTNTNGGGGTTTTTTTTTTTNGGGTKTGGTVIYNNTNPVVQVSQSGSSSSADQMKLIIIFAVIVVVIIAGAVGSYFIYRRYKSKQMLENVNKTMKQVPADSIRDSSVSSNQFGDNEVYEPQYHPKAELGNIFGGGKTAKINYADDVAQEEETIQYDENGIPVNTDQSAIEDQSTPLHSSLDVSGTGNGNDHQAYNSTQLQRKRSSLRFANQENNSNNNNNNAGPIDTKAYSSI